MLDDVQDDLQQGRRGGRARKIAGCSTSMPRSCARWSSELQADAARRSAGHRGAAKSSRACRRDNDNMPRISKMQIDLMVNSFAADFARVATLQYTNSVGGAKMRWLGIDEGHHELSHEPDTNEKAAEKLIEDQPLVLRAARLPGQATGRNARAGRRRQPARQHADRLDQRTGQRQFAHAGQHSVRAGRRRARFPHGPLAQVSQACRTTGCCCRWPTASGHRITTVRQPRLLRRRAADGFSLSGRATAPVKWKKSGRSQNRSGAVPRP